MASTTFPDDHLLTVEELSEYLSVPLASIYQWRARRIAPPAMRVGRYIRFRKSTVDQWLEARSDVA